MTKKLTIISVFFFMAFFTSFAQKDNGDVFTTPAIQDELTKDADQNERWRKGEYGYSAKPKNAWEVGINLGHFMISGDLHSNVFQGFGIGLHARKSITYALSVRADLFYGKHRGVDVREIGISTIQSERFYRQNIDNAQAAVQQYSSSGEPFIRNYKTSVVGGSISAILSLGNILFHQEKNKWGVYGQLGLGIYAPSVQLNLLNDNGSVHDFSSALQGLNDSERKDRKEIIKNVRDILDGDDFNYDGAYEEYGSLIGDEKDLIPSLHLGIGVSRKLNKRVNLTLEHQVMISDNDLLDGYEFRTAEDESNNNDVIQYTNLRLNINLGRFSERTEPLYWMNPVAPAMNDIVALKQRPELDLTDTDEDGIIDMLDQEIESPAGAPVDTRGVALDSDGDGLLDHMDQEPYSPIGYPIDDKGIAQIPEGPTYTTEDDVNRLINNKIGSIDFTTDWWLPMIHFDLDKYYIKPEFYPELHQVATALKQNPSVRVVVKGFADVRNPNDYNRVLSYNRAQAAIDYLVRQYSIDRNRLILQYGGEDQPLVSGLPDNHSISKDKEMQQYLNRRVEFYVATTADQPMGRPAGPEAGESTPGSSRSGAKYSGNRNSGY